MTTPPKLAARGVRCLECAHVDLKGDPAAARRGMGRCLQVDPPIYVPVEMARNCLPFEPAPPETVTAREMWAEKLAPWFSRQ